MAKDKDYSKYFLKAMERAAESGGSLSSQSETESQDDAAYGKFICSFYLISNLGIYDNFKQSRVLKIKRSFWTHHKLI